jgi:hypothetical protein
MMSIIVLFAFIILLSVSGLHFYWAFGGRFGGPAVIPSKVGGEVVFVPRMLETLAVALLTLAAGVLLLVQNDYFSIYTANVYTYWGCLLCGLVFFIRTIGDFRYMGFTKRIKGTAFANNDTRYYSPLCFFLSAVFVLSVI